MSPAVDSYILGLFEMLVRNAFLQYTYHVMLEHTNFKQMSEFTSAGVFSGPYCQGGELN